MNKFLSAIFPYKKYYYSLNCDQEYFLKKLELLILETEKNYAPGKYYIAHNKDTKCISFNRKKINPGSGSAGTFRYYYSLHDGKVYVTCSMGYSAFLYFLFLVFSVLTLGLVFILFNLVFQMEAFIISDDFNTHFQEEIVAKSYDDFTVYLSSMRKV